MNREIIRAEWIEYAIVDDSFESADVRLNADRIAEWWIDKLEEVKKDLLETVVQEINKLDTQKFLDKKCQVGDFVKLEDILAILTDNKIYIPKKECINCRLGLCPSDCPDDCDSQRCDKHKFPQELLVKEKKM